MSCNKPRLAFVSTLNKKALIKIFTSLLLIAIASQGISQSISGKVINDATQEPLCYASIGVISSTLGTITNEKGNFKLDLNGYSPETKIRISMIGFESSIIQLKDLTSDE